MGWREPIQLNLTIERGLHGWRAPHVWRGRRGAGVWLWLRGYGDMPPKPKKKE